MNPYLLTNTFFNPATRNGSTFCIFGCSAHTLKKVSTVADVDAETAHLAGIISGIEHVAKHFASAANAHAKLPVIVSDPELVSKLNGTIGASKTKLGANAHLWAAIAEAKKGFEITFFANIQDVPADSILTAVLRGWLLGI